MKIGPSLTLQQKQKLVITPRLRQAIEILQLSAVELKDYIEHQLLENPVLEKSEEGEDQEPVEALGDVVSPEWLEYFSDSSDLGYTRVYQEKETVSYERAVVRVPNLEEHLLSQFNLVVKDELDRRVGEFLIGSIDQAGYLALSVDAAAKTLGVSRERVEKNLALVQRLDPPGIGARDLRECLLIQLRVLGERDEVAERIVAEYLEDLGAGRLTRIVGSLGISRERVQRALDTIRRLDPKPGRKFGYADEVRYIVPDVTVERVGDQFVILVNDYHLPRLAVSPFYRNLLNDRTSSHAIRQYINEKINAAIWLIKSIEQRRLTLFRVVEAIVSYQKRFLEAGVKYLLPMTLRQVAEEIGVHESTVSRATANKFAQTPQGIFELRFFFQSGVSSSGGTGVSAQSVKEMIRELVTAEDAAKPLSDQDLADRLRQQGVAVSRRTVAKYRNEIGIPPSTRRKRY